MSLQQPIRFLRHFSAFPSHHAYYKDRILRKIRFQVDSRSSFRMESTSPSPPSNRIISKVDENGVRRIVINRPEQKNALSFEMMGALGEAVLESNTDSQTKLITITGAGDFFSSGADLNNWKTGTLEEIQAKNRKYVLDKFMLGFLDCRKPIIALVNGGAVGAGATLLPFCDLVIASDKAFFYTPFPQLHIVPEFCSSYTFPKIMGTQRANNMLLFAHKMSAEEALTCGFVNFLFPHDKFEANCEELIEKYRNFPVDAMIGSKEVIRAPEREKLRHLCAYEMHLVIQAAGSPEMQANLKKFFEKKKTKQ